MKRRAALVAIALSGAAAIPRISQAAPPVKENTHNMQTSELTILYDGDDLDSRAFVVMQGRAFKTLGSTELRKYILEHFPAHNIHWDRGCKRGDERMPTDEEVTAFANFCKENTIKLTIPPAG